MKWPRRIALALLLLFIPLLLITERLRGQWALNAWKRQVLAHRETLNVSSLVASPPLPSSNGAPVLIAAALQLSSVPDSVPPGMKFLDSQQAVVLTSLEEWESETSKPKGVVTHRWGDVERELEKAQEPLRQIQEALRKPAFDRGVDYANGFIDFDVAGLAQFKRTAQWLSFLCTAELRRGHGQEAFDALTALNSLMKAQATEPLIISQLVRAAIVHFAFSTLWQCLQSDAFSSAQLESFAKQWQENNFVNSMTTSFEVERAMTVDHFRLLRGSKTKLDNAIQGIAQTGAFFGSDDSLDSNVVKYLQVPLWRIAYSYHDELESLQIWQQRIEEARTLQTNFWSGLKDSGVNEDDLSPPFAPSSKPLSFYDKLRFLFSSSSSFGTRAALSRAVRADTLKQLALAGIALKRFHIATGHFPESISDLAPVYCSRVPIDPMDGKPLRYRKTKQSFVLYSIGEDGKDDNGDSSLAIKKAEKTSLWDGHDIVWPEAVRTNRLALKLNPKIPAR